MKLLGVLSLVFAVKEALGTNSILFGPGFPSKFTCTSDAYGLEAAKYQLPKDVMDKVLNSTIETTRYIENPEDIGLERELVENSLTLHDESKIIKVGLRYPSIEYRLQQHIAKDYVAAQSTLASLNTLRSLTYVINILKAFAKSNYTKYNAKDTEEAKFGMCSVVVYTKIVDKLEQNRAKQMAKIKAETKRITHNISQLGRVKSTGNLWLLTSGFSASLIATGVAAVLVATFYSM